MDQNFTTKGDSAYIASVSQEKKINFLQRQLYNSQQYAKTLQKSQQALKETVNKLIKQRSKHQVLSKLTQSLYRLEKRIKEMQMQLKECNAKLLIQMQLRIQQKAQYLQKMLQLQQTIVDLRKSNKDKENQFTVIVNKLRKYQDIREMTLQEKIKNEDKKSLAITNRYKEELLTSMGQQISKLKKYNGQYICEIDKKLRVIGYALQNQFNYEEMKKMVINQNNEGQEIEQKKQQKSNVKKNKNAGNMKMNGSNIELIRQIKRLVINNRILEESLNQCIEKNEQLLANNQILMNANSFLEERLRVYKNTEIRYTNNNILQGSTISRHSKKYTQSRINSRKSKQENMGEVLEIKDDSELLMEIENNVEEKRLRRYIETLKSEDYEINIEELGHDVGKISEFLMLSLEKQSKGYHKNNQRRKMGEENNKVRSISAQMGKKDNFDDQYDEKGKKDQEYEIEEI